MIGFASLLLLGQLASDPYVRSRSATIGPTGEAAALHWSAGTVEMRQNVLGSVQTPADSEFPAVGRAIRHWQQQFDACGNMHLVVGAHTESQEVGFSSSRPSNENIIVFREKYCLDSVDPQDSCWTDDTCGNTYGCWDHSPGTIALTTTSYDPETGRLYDADIEGNAAGFLFTTVDAPPCSSGGIDAGCVAFDVENTFTHEMGHVVGLAHTSYPGSTMNPSAPLGETSKRTLDDGSLAFVCEAYPKGRPSTDGLPPPAALNGSSFSCVASPGLPGLLGPLVWVGLSVLRRHLRGSAGRR